MIENIHCRYKSLIISCLVVAFLAAIPIGQTARAQFVDLQQEGAAPDGEAPADSAALATMLVDVVRELVAPVALYPDELLALVLPAATNPLQIVEASRFLEKQRSDPSLQPNADWDGTDNPFNQNKGES